MLLVAGGPVQDEISVGFSGGQFTVESPAGVNSSTCDYDSPTRVRCPDLGGGVVVIGGRRGDDSIRLIGNRVNGGVTGDGGADNVQGNSKHNRLFGGSGGDEIRGGAGPDLLVGQGGYDVLLGQKGADRIRAEDGQRDLVIDCGPGLNDRAIIDRGIDPKPVGCERVEKLP